MQMDLEVCHRKRRILDMSDYEEIWRVGGWVVVW